MPTEFAVMEAKETPVPAPATQSREQPSPSWRLPKPWLLPGLVSGLLLWMAFFPLSWGPVAWFALVPLLSLIRLKVSKGRVFWGAYLAGLFFFWTVLQWMRVADYRMNFTWGMLATYCAIYFPVGIALIRFLDRRTPLPLVLTVPLVWTALEFIRSWLMTGFAWYFLGHTQHSFLPIIQICDVTGVYGVSFLIAAVNGWLLECLWQMKPVRQFLGVVDELPRSRPVTLLGQGTCLGLLAAAFVIYGHWQLGRGDFRPGPRLAMLQGNIDQRIRNQAEAPDQVEKRYQLLDGYKLLCERACWEHPPELIVWPETAFTYGWRSLEGDPNKTTNEQRRSVIDRWNLLGSLTNQLGASQLIGTNCEVVLNNGKRKLYNSALLFPHQASGAKMDRYDKIHRVPFGEYVPLKDSLPFMNYFAPYENDYSIQIGEKLTRFQLRDFRFGVLICNEDTDPALARGYGIGDKDGPAVDFLLNISNDSWFDDTCEHEQHLALCRFRAIECRRALARSVNTGISAIIDSNGRVQKPQHERPFYHEIWEIKEVDGEIPDLPESEWADYKKVEGVLRGSIPIDHRGSLYVRWGDWLPWSCCIVIALGFVWGWLPFAGRGKSAG